ncbi:DNA repair protein RecO [Candidatus Parcubacteria bacterium]|nr:MAG: DNA repair protein RecO [Candidatus Parcubacteria bacterium]
MKYLKDTGFVIKKVNLGDADRFVTILSKNHGKVEVLAKGVRKITSRRASALEPLNLIKFQAIERKKTPLLTEVELINPFSSSKNSLSNISLIFLVCELVDKLCPYGQKNESVFNLVGQTLNKISLQNISSTIFNFEKELITILGFWDANKDFRNQDDIQSYIESIIERKIKTTVMFG